MDSNKADSSRKCKDQERRFHLSVTRCSASIY